MINLDVQVRRVRVLVVDDSDTSCEMFRLLLNRDPALEVVATAKDALAARDLIVELRPDVVTLDLDMPGVSGLTFLERLMKHHPLPVVVVSSLTTEGCALAMDSLAAGAVEVLSKPRPDYPVTVFAEDLKWAVKAARAARILGSRVQPRWRKSQAATAPQSSICDLIALGASTGGTVALERVLMQMPTDCAPIAIVQHMPKAFTASFAQRLARECRIQVKEAEDGEELTRGLAVVAPGDSHLQVDLVGGRFIARLGRQDPVHRHRPSVDVLFESVARSAGRRAGAALLTGMGRDGAAGLLALRQEGAFTLAQDEASSVVFGMPKAAIELGAAKEILGLEELSARLALLARRASGFKA